MLNVPIVFFKFIEYGNTSTLCSFTTRHVQRNTTITICNEIGSSNQNVTICKDGQRDKFNLIRRSVKLNNVEGISRLLGTVLTSYYRYFTVKRFRLKHWKYLQNYLSTQTITTLFFVYSKEFSYVVFLGKTKSELFFQQK